MSEQTYRERWKREIYRTPLITDSVRVALLALSDDMDDDGMVDVAQKELAELLDKSGRRVGGRLSGGIKAGFLERVKRGQRNGKGRYQGTLPDRSSGHPRVLKTGGVLATHGCPEDGSLQDTFKPEETSGLGDTRGSSRGKFDPSVFRTPEGPEETAPSIGTARAHSKTADRSSQTAHAEDDDSRTGGVVVALFDGDIKPSLRSQTPVRPSAPASGEHPAFAEWYAAYPVHKARGAAVKAFTKAAKKTDPQILIAAAKRYRDDPQVARGYAKHPATWLNQECWLDEPAGTTQAAVGDPHQQATNDWMNRALERARTRDAQEGHR